MKWVIGYELALEDQRHSWHLVSPQALSAKTKPEQGIFLFHLRGVGRE